jgi:hypothetical protein
VKEVGASDDAQGCGRRDHAYCREDLRPCRAYKLIRARDTIHRFDSYCQCNSSSSSMYPLEEDHGV